MPVRPPGSALIAAALLIALAASFWAVFLPQASSAVFGRVPYLDEILYLDRAAALSDDEAADEPLFMAPLYPRLITAVGSGAEAPGRDVFAPAELRGLRLLQISCWFGTLVLLGTGGWHLARRRAAGGARRQVAAWAPAVLFLLYRPAAIFAVSVLAETVLTFLVTFALYLALRAAGGTRRLVGLAFLAGLALGTGALLRATCLVLVPVVAWALWRGAATRRQAVVAAGLLLVTCTAVLLPASLHNSRVAGRPAGPTFNGGLNLYIGNGPAANGYYVQVIPGDLRQDPAGTRLLAARTGRPAVTIPEADRLWRDAALAEMRAHPARTAGLWLKKVWLQIQAWEIDQLAPLSAWRGEASALAALPVPYGLIAALALVGIVAGRREKGVRLLAAALLLLVAGQAVFFVVSRYRQVLVPVLALLAGAGVAALGQRPRRAVPVLVAAVLAVVPWGQGAVRQQIGQLGLANAAQRWGVLAAHGEPGAAGRAEALYRRSLAGHRTDYEPWLGLATVLDAQRRTDEAIAVLTEGAGAARRPRELERTLVALLIRTGRRGAALARVDAVLAADPDDPDMLHNAAYLLAESGDTDGAQARAMELIARHPSDPRGYADLGILLARQGRREEAQAAFEAGLRAAPGDSGLLRHLAQLEAGR